MAGGPGSGRPWGPLALSNVLTMRLGVELISPLFTPSLPRRAPNPNIGAVPLISHLSAHHSVCVQRRCLSSYIVLPLLCFSLSACATEAGNWASPLHLLALRVSSYAHNAHMNNKGPGLNMSLAGQQVVKSEPQKRLRFKTTSHKIYFTIYLGFYSPLICVWHHLCTFRIYFVCNVESIGCKQWNTQWINANGYIAFIIASFQLFLKRFTQISLNASLLSKLTLVTRQLTTMTLSTLTLVLQVLKKPRLGPRWRDPVDDTSCHSGIQEKEVPRWGEAVLTSYWASAQGSDKAKKMISCVEEWGGDERLPLRNGRDCSVT